MSDAAEPDPRSEAVPKADRAAAGGSSALDETLRRVERAAGSLATLSVARMDAELAWFRAMPPEQRSWVTLIAQAGVTSLVEWMREPGSAPQLTGEVFGRAPRALLRAVSLRQTVELVRITVEVVESRVDELAPPGQETALRESVLRFSREIAFAAAQLYAAAAENRGAWDVRLEAMIVDALLLGDAEQTLPSRGAALGWGEVTPVTVVAGRAKRRPLPLIHQEFQRHARAERVDVLAGVHGDRAIVVLGGTTEPLAVAGRLLSCFGAGPVVIGPTVERLGQAGSSANAALSGLRAVAAWPTAPRPVLADDLLPERALDGDAAARHRLAIDVYGALLAGGPTVVDTLAEYLNQGGALEGTARALYIHPNTVRYRLRRAATLCGISPIDARGAYTLQLALAFGRLAASTEGSGPTTAAGPPKAAL